ncbi:hypothetical protein [Paraburkholderia sp. HP33-1]|nr:hypothetical protein [Paraburkholderia sp. HP33-1]
MEQGFEADFRVARRAIDMKMKVLFRCSDLQKSACGTAASHP